MTSDLIYVQRGEAFHISRTLDGPALGIVATGNNMDGWGWTCGFGWHTGLPTFDAALDALQADPRFGADVLMSERADETSRRDAVGIAVANWWLRRVLTLECLVRLDANHRRGLACRCQPPADVASHDD